MNKIIICIFALKLFAIRSMMIDIKDLEKIFNRLLQDNGYNETDINHLNCLYSHFPQEFVQQTNKIYWQPILHFIAGIPGQYSDDAGKRLMPPYHTDFGLLLKFLAEKKFDINQKNSRGQTPLHLAIGSGNLHTVESLLKLGADPNIYEEESKSHQSPLYIALSLALAYPEETDRPKIVKLLVLADANWHAKRTNGESDLDFLNKRIDFFSEEQIKYEENPKVYFSENYKFMYLEEAKKKFLNYKKVIDFMRVLLCEHGPWWQELRKINALPSLAVSLAVLEVK